jgi:hypothetical protein
MPDEGEFASYKPLRRIVESDRVQKLLGNYQVKTSSDLKQSLDTLNPVKIEFSSWTPNNLIAIDGSQNCY